MTVLKRKEFARWQAGEKLPDTTLCKAVREMEGGLFDADLGGLLYKKRVARAGAGKRGGYRTLLSARIGDCYVFLHGFPKSDKANITQVEKNALQYAGEERGQRTFPVEQGSAEERGQRTFPLESGSLI